MIGEQSRPWRRETGSGLRHTLARIVALLALGVSPAWAQVADAGLGVSRRVAFDTVAGYQDFFAEDADWPTQFIVDAFAAIELAPGVQVSVRPVLWRVGGEWESLLDQASLRYEFRRGVNWRVEAGKFPSPIGLGMTENRANVNPGVIWCHRPYYMAVPSQGRDVPPVSLVSAVYPWGAQVTSSGTRWDVRAGVVDLPPVAFWQRADGDARGANRIVGGGLTPRQGMRVGASRAWGRYARATPSRAALDYDTLTVEADVAFGHSRLSGEWVRSQLDAPGGQRASEGWTAQAQHTVTPRVFVHGRLSSVHSPQAATSQSTTVVAQRFRSIDTTAGYLLTPEVTLRVAHTAIRGFGRGAVDHQLGVSVVWTKRWW